MWKNIGLIAVGVLVGMVVLIAWVLMLDPSPPETAYWQTVAPHEVSRNGREQELVMANGPLFACKNPTFFASFAELFIDDTFTDGEKAMWAEQAMQGFLDEGYCVYLRVPIMLTRAEKMGVMRVAAGGVITSYIVSVHAPGSDQHYFSTIVLIDGKKYDQLSLTLYALESNAKSNPKKKL